MPNHVKNILKIEGQEDEVRFIFGCISGDTVDQLIDFNRIIPAPPFRFNSFAGQKEEALAKKFNVPIWTKFNRGNWGTKWNAYSQDKIDDNTISFDTAWSSSQVIVDAIAKKFTSVLITLTYADEDTGSNVGVIQWNNGVREENIPQNISKEAFDIAFKVRPHCAEDYALVDGKYTFIGE